MRRVADRMRERARELGVPDAEVARRAGLSQTRYSNYVNDRYEPDLATFLRICEVLGASASDMLARDVPAGDAVGRLRARVAAAMEALDMDAMRALETVVDGLVARASAIRGGTAVRTPASTSKTPPSLPKPRAGKRPGPRQD